MESFRWDSNFETGLGLVDVQHHGLVDLVNALGAVARTLAREIRTDDLACRLGGDEFLVICPVTPLEGTARLAEALRLSVAALAVETGSGAWHGSLSLGVAARTGAMAGPDDLLRHADKRLYLAKRAGRNRVCAGTGPAAVAA